MRVLGGGQRTSQKYLRSIAFKKLEIKGKLTVILRKNGNSRGKKQFFDIQATEILLNCLYNERLPLQKT